MTALTELLALLSEAAGPIFLTLRVAASTALTLVLIGFPIAYFSARHRGVLSRVLLFLSTLPLVFPPIALGYLLMLLLGQHGFLGAWLNESWGLRVLFSEAAVMIAASIAGLPLVVRPLKEALENE